jgi:hypothetical protein
VFLGLNNWLIVDLRMTSGAGLDDVQEACLCKQMGKEIKQGQIGAVATDDTATLGYYLVHFTSNVFPFAPENRETVDEDNQQIEEGSLVVRARFYSLMQGAPFWYIPPCTGTKEDPSLLFRVQTVLAGNLKLHPMEFGVNEAPRNKHKAVEKNASVKLMEDDHIDLLEEIAHCERIHQEETVVVAPDGEEDDWTTEGGSSNEEEEEEDGNN